MKRRLWATGFPQRPPEYWEAGRGTVLLLSAQSIETNPEVGYFPPMEDDPATSLATVQSHAAPARLRNRTAVLFRLEAQLRDGASADHVQGIVDGTDRSSELPGQFAELSARRLGIGDQRGAITALERADALGPEPQRSETIAGWYEGIGNHAAAAAWLFRCLEVPATSAGIRLRRRTSALFWRAGQAGKAAEQLAEVARLEPDSVDALEALAALSYWASEDVSRERAVVALLESSRRLRQQGARLPAFEALLRAFEVRPGSQLVAEQLTRDLRSLGRVEAADEVLRLSAEASGDSERHAMRAEEALAQGDLGRALIALLDARRDRELSLPPLERALESLLSGRSLGQGDFDALLARLGLADWLAARFDIATALGEVGGAGWTQLARLESTHFTAHEAANAALGRALRHEPRHSEARAMLAAGSTPLEPLSPLLRALVLASRRDTPPSQHQLLADELLEWAGKLDVGAALGIWALDQRRRGGNPRDDQFELESQFAERLGREDGERTDWETELSSCPPDKQHPWLERLEARLALDPLRGERHLEVLLALCAQGDLRYLSLALAAFEVELERTPRQELAGVRAVWVTGVIAVLGEPARLAAARVELERNDIEAASDWLGAPEQAVSPRALCWHFTLARRLSDTARIGQSLFRIGASLPAPLRGLLEAVAAEHLFAGGAIEAALVAQRSAVRVAPGLARLVTLEVQLAAIAGPKAVCQTVERALGVIPPSADFGAALARAHGALGDTELALAWWQRAAALRPGDAALRCEVLESAMLHGDCSRVVELLLRLPDCALPLGAWTPMAATALAWLSAQEPRRAVEVTKRLVMRTGATDPTLRAAMLAVAGAERDDGLGCDILMRSAAGCSEPALIEAALAQRYVAAGQFGSALHAALRAAHAGAHPDCWLRFAEHPLDGLDGDALLAALELRQLASFVAGDEPGRVFATRQLAFALFDLAQDRRRSLALIETLLGLAPNAAPALIAADLSELLGPVPARDWLLNEARCRSADDRAIGLFDAAIRLSVRVAPDEVTGLILECVRRAPERIDLLVWAERAATTPRGVEQLDQLYDALAQETLGLFGERALHYRASRTLERRGEYSRALRHAVLAFEAIPSEGVVFRALGRVSRLAGDSGPMCDALSVVAERAPDRVQAARWRVCAYEALGHSSEDRRVRLELALRILVGFPSVEGVTRLSKARQDLLVEFDESGLVDQRVERALRSLVETIDGPDGARLGIAIACFALEQLERPDVAAPAIAKALDADADLDEFALLLPTLEAVLRVSEVAVQFREHALSVLRRPFSNLARPALELLASAALFGQDLEWMAACSQSAARIHESVWFEAWLIENAPAKSPLLAAIARARLTNMRAAGQDIPLDKELEWLELALSGAEAESTEAEVGSWLRHGTIRVFEVQGLRQARHLLERFEARVTLGLAAQVRVELEQRGGDIDALERALAFLALVPGTPPEDAVVLLRRAAELARTRRDRLAFIGYCRAVVSMAPLDASSQIELASDAYLHGGYGSEGAQVWLTTLETVACAQVELEARREFLLAEARSRLDGAAAGYTEVLEALKRLGSSSLLELALAERLVARGQAVDALPHFESALAGVLAPLKSFEVVAVQAARVAKSLGELETALEWLARSQDSDETRPMVLALQAEIQGILLGRRERALRLEREAAELAAREAAELAAREAAELAAREAAERAAREAAELAAREAAERAAREAALEVMHEPPSVAPMQPVQPSPSGMPPTGRNDDGDGATVRFEPSGTPEPTSIEEALGWAEWFMADARRRHEWLSIGRRWLSRWPWETRLIARVRDVAHAEQHLSHVHALEHVHAVLTQAMSVPLAPELGDQAVDTESLRAVLFRGAETSTGEALEMVWEGAERTFRREPSEYGVTGLERVVVGTPTALARSFGEASWHLGMSRTPLFHRRGPRSMSGAVALTNPISIVVEGDTGNDERRIAYHVGAWCAAAFPQHALLFGLSPTRAQTLVVALGLAFGPPKRQSSRSLGDSLRLAEMLWESIRATGQRRLRELCEVPLDYEQAMRAAQSVSRRAGLYVCADLRTALAEIASEESLDMSHLAPGDWERLCQRYPSLLDILRFATSSEYADLRWRSARPVTGSFGRLW